MEIGHSGYESSRLLNIMNYDEMTADLEFVRIISRVLYG